MDRRRCLFILISTILHLSIIRCDDTKRQPIDFLKPTNGENDQVMTSTSTKSGEEMVTPTVKPSGVEPPHGIHKFFDDVKNKFNHIHPVRDVKEILFGSSEKKATTTIASSVHSVTTAAPTNSESHIDKIIESMPSESEDMIRVVTLKEDQHYGKGKAKPKYLTMELEKMNSTEYTDNSTSTSKVTVKGKSALEDFSTSTTTQKVVEKSGRIGDSIPK